MSATFARLRVLALTVLAVYGESMQTLRTLAPHPTVRTPRMQESELVDLGYAAEKTGFDEYTLRRLIDSGDLPAMQLANATGDRTFRKVPRALIDAAHAVVMSGGQVELREFCRQWAARNATEAVA